MNKGEPIINIAWIMELALLDCDIFFSKKVRENQFNKIYRF